MVRLLSGIMYLDSNLKLLIPVRLDHNLICGIVVITQWCYPRKRPFCNADNFCTLAKAAIQLLCACQIQKFLQFCALFVTFISY